MSVIGGYPIETESYPQHSYHEMSNYYVTPADHPLQPHDHLQAGYEMWSPQQHAVDMTQCPDSVQPTASPPINPKHHVPQQNFSHSADLPNFSHYLPPQFTISPHGGVVVQPPVESMASQSGVQQQPKKGKTKDGKPVKPKGTPGRKVKVPDSEVSFLIFKLYKLLMCYVFSFLYCFEQPEEVLYFLYRRNYCSFSKQ